MEGTNQQVATAPQPASVTPTVSAPSVAYQPVMSQSPTYQASPTVPQTIPVAPPVTYQPQAGQPVSVANQGEANPWQEAFQALSASLNINSQSPARAQSLAYQTPTPQQAQQLSWDSQANSAIPQHLLNRTSTQYVTPTPAAQAPMPQNQAEVQVTDGYLNAVSDLSLEVLEHFGAEAPALLNQYACAVEDALIDQVHITQEQDKLLQAAGRERQAMNTMLTNPDILADYVNDFFGPNGPYPTLTNDEKRQLAAQQEQVQRQQRRNQIEAEMYGMERQNAVPKAFKRPEGHSMPRRSKEAQGVQNFWNGFGSVMDNNPENAWKFLAQADPRAFQGKLLVQDL